jgi:TRAP-type C4-dicarboxylate transport system substrate-binding protein
MRRIAILITCLSSTAWADPHVLRMATPAPDGTSWAREIKAFVREAEMQSADGLKFKVYYGGIAGDEGQIADRIARNQVDGLFSGGMLCERVVPSVRVLMLPGLFETREEISWVAQQLYPQFAEEARAAGYALLGTSVIGPVVILSRAPVRNLAELRAAKLWMWGEDSLKQPLQLLGLTVAPGPLNDALKIYESGEVDGLLAIPAAALAFQWSAHAKYLIDLRTRHLSACLMIANRAFDGLPVADQRALRAAGAKVYRRLEDVAREQDDELLGGLFARQGMTPVPVSRAFRTEFFQAARKTLDQLDPKVVAPSLIAKVQALLQEHRRKP